MGLMDYVKEGITSGVREVGRRIESEVNHVLYKNYYRFKRRLFKDITSLFIMLIALIFISISIVYLLIEYLALSKTLAFGIIGIVLLLIGIVIKSS
jgi:hypothetical protein